MGRDLAHMEEKRKEYNIMVVKTEASDGSVILKCILEKQDGVALSGFVWLVIGQVAAGSCEIVTALQVP